MKAVRAVLLLISTALLSTGATCGSLGLTPDHGTFFTTPQVVTLEAVFNSPRINELTRVEFVKDDVRPPMCSVTEPPYQCSWSITAADNGVNDWVAYAHIQNGDVIEGRTVSLIVQIDDTDGVDPGPVDPPDPGLVGFLPGIGSPMGVAADGGGVFVASAEFGVSSVDADGTHVIGLSDLKFFATALAVQGTLGVALGESPDGMAHIWVLDLSDIERPQVVGELPTTLPGGNARDVVLDPTGTRAVAALGQAGIWVINLGDRENPWREGDYDTPGFAYGVDLADGFAYVADGIGDLVILDLSRSTPELASSLSLSGIYRDVAVANGFAYLANQGGDSRVVDVRTPSAPVLVAALQTVQAHYVAAGVTAEGPRVAFVGPGDSLSAPDQLQLFDTLDPGAPIDLGIADLPDGASRGIALSGDRAYVALSVDTGFFVATGTKELHVYDVRSSPSLVQVLQDDFVGRVADSAGRWAVVLGERVSTGLLSIQVLDLIDVQRPKVVGELPTTLVAGNASDVALDATGTRAVLALGQAGIWVVNLGIANPEHPENPWRQGSYDTPGFAYGLDLADGFAYVADGPGDLVILDLSDPADPSLASSLSLSGIYRDVAVTNGFAYLASQQGSAKVVDVRTPSSPRFVRSFGGQAFWVAAEGARVALLGSGSNGTTQPPDVLGVYDVSVPHEPVWLGSGDVPSGAGRGVALVGGRAYVAADTEGLLVYDVTGSAWPQPTSRFWPVGASGSVSVDGTGSRVIVADSAATMGVLLAP